MTLLLRLLALSFAVFLSGCACCGRCGEKGKKVSSSECCDTAEADRVWV